MLAPGTPIGRYVVTRKLAEGGMAELYLAKATGPDGFAKDVVIKQIRTFLASDEGFIEMFKAEARLASRLNHANIVQIFDFARHEDTYYLAMEYVQGCSLWDLRKRCREHQVAFPPIVAAEICTQVARALHSAHSLTERGKPLNLVHRDVTPHNVLLSFEGAVKLTDFGIAKAGTSATAPGMLKGKFAYMSPEQARGEAVDARTDVFALGVVLWELLTGQRLFEGDSDVAVLRAVQEAPIRRPSALNPEVSEELCDVVLRALERDPARRFQSAQELERALANFVLRAARSAEDTSVGAFVRQMFHEELDALHAAELAMGQGTASRTPVHPPGDAKPAAPEPSLVVASASAQTWTPAPGAEAVPRTAQQPGVRPSRRLGALEDAEDVAQKPTEQFDELPKRDGTAQMPGVRPSKRLAELEQEAQARAAAAAAELGSATTVARAPSKPLGAPPEAPAPPQPAPAESLEGAVTDPRAPPLAEEPPPPAALTWPWIAAACVALGVLGGVGYAVFPTGEPPSSPAVVELTVAPSPPAAVDAGLAAALPAEEPPVEAAVALAEAPVPPEPVAVEKTVAARPAQPAARPAATATLVITATPFATILLRGKPIGEVQGKSTFHWAPGDYPLILQHPKRTESRTVTLSAGKTTSIEFHALGP